MVATSPGTLWKTSGEWPYRSGLGTNVPTGLAHIPATGDRRVIDTRFDTDHVLSRRSRRLVDVCTELGLDVTQPELRGTSMTALHRAWLVDHSFETRERVSVLNLRHSSSTALVALRVTNRATGPALSTSTACSLLDSTAPSPGSTTPFTELL